MEKVGSNCKKLYFKEMEKQREESESLIRLMNLRLVAGGWDLSVKHTHTRTHTGKATNTQLTSEADCRVESLK